MHPFFSLCRTAAASVCGWFVRHFRRWNELYLGLSLILWFPASQRILIALNPGSAAPIQFDVLHKLYLACLVFAVGKAFLYIGQWINTPYLNRYHEEQSKTDFNSLTPCQRQDIALRASSWDLLCFSLLFLAAMLAG
ncbi:hypothetical protein [Hymenobacter tenuis]